jgi:hypothetical protein
MIEKSFTKLLCLADGSKKGRQMVNYFEAAITLCDAWLITCLQ